MNIRLLEAQWTSFVQNLCLSSDLETAGIILAERMQGGQGLIARHFVTIPDEAYLIRRADQIRLDPVALNRLIRPAREAGLSIVTVHTHPGTVRPWFSTADDAGDARLMPSLFNQMPGPHGSMVIAGGSGMAIGRVWINPDAKVDLEVRIVGLRLRVPPRTGPSDDEHWYDRQRLALGEDGQNALKRLRVAIVGLGGTGSAVLLQLAHLGVRGITVVDGDRVEQSNVSRILGATISDVGHWKVDVAARYAESLGLGTEVQCLRGNLGREVSPSDIDHCDVIMACVDRHLPRTLLNRLSYGKAVPLIDMGTAFRVNPEGRVVAGVGRVVVVGPQRPCLACWGHIDPNRIRIESLSEVDRAREVADGYISGAEVRQPSVVAFNTMVAGAAVIEFLRLATGFAGMDDPPLRLSFDFARGSVRRNLLSGDRDCKICLPVRVIHGTIQVIPDHRHSERTEGTA